MITRIDPARLGLKDALDLAILMEEEAAERYQDFADQLRTHGTPAAAALFAALADEETRHGQELATRRRSLFGDDRRTVTRAMLWDVEAPAFDQASAFMNIRAALTVALEAERKAQAFFAGLVPVAADPQARALFAELEAEEVAHVRRVRIALDGLERDHSGEAIIPDGNVGH